MNINRLSSNFIVKRLQQEDIPVILNLCHGNKLYYDYCPPAATAESIENDMNALPPGTTEDDKYYVGFYENEKLIAVLDLIVGFPDGDTVYFGFFMMDTSKQKHGIGSVIIAELCSALLQENYKRVQLAWVSGNPQAEAFWHKNGFKETGAVSEMEEYSVVVAEKILEN
jgi:RimJ/RimL family protein N-acetyltransferase